MWHIPSWYNYDFKQSMQYEQLPRNEQESNNPVLLPGKLQEWDSLKW